MAEILKPKTLDGNSATGRIDLFEHHERGTPYIRIEVQPMMQLLTADEAFQLAAALAKIAAKLAGVPF